MRCSHRGGACSRPSALCSTFSLWMSPSGASWSAAQYDSRTRRAWWRLLAELLFALPVHTPAAAEDAPSISTMLKVHRIGDSIPDFIAFKIADAGLSRYDALSL